LRVTRTQHAHARKTYDHHSRTDLRPLRLWNCRPCPSGIGPAKAILLARPAIVDLARQRGLTVTPYTFRSGATGTFPDVAAEMRHFLDTLDVDALFTDNPDQFPRR